MRVMSFNTNLGRTSDYKPSLLRQAGAIMQHQPDVVMLQEVHSRTIRRGFLNQAKELSTNTNLPFYAFGKTVKSRLGIGGFGNAILSRYPLREVENHIVPKPVGVSTEDRDERGVLQAVIDLNGISHYLFCVHYSFRSQLYRIENSQFLLNRLPPEWPKIVGGDLNALQASQEVAMLSPVLSNARREFNSEAPESIDYIFFNHAGKRRYLVEQFETIETDASDHKPILADLKFEDSL